MLAQATLQKLKNAESSLVFMREQHARTLEGLHEEIHKLQKKNARLTFELTMKGPLNAPAGVTGCTECKHLEESLTNSKAEILKLRSALTSSEDQVHLLDHQLEELDTKFSEEVRIRDEKLNKQGGDLESKANTIAMLTQQLYNTKVRLRNEIQVKNVNGPTSSHATSSAVCVCSHCHFHKESPAVTGERCALGDGGVPVDYQVPAATGASDQSKVSRIQRRHFRNSSSPVAQDVRNFSESSDDNYLLPSRTSARRLPTPPLTPRPPPSATSQTSSMIRRASNPIRKQSPSPRSSGGQFSSGSLSSVTPRASISSLDDESAQSSDSTSTTSVSNGRKMLDPVQVYRQGVLPPDLSELLQSRESRGDLREQPQKLVFSKPDPLPPIPSSDDDISNQTTPNQSEIFSHHDSDPATSAVDFNSYTTSHPSDPPAPWFKGHHHPHHTHHHPVAIGSRQQHRHFILTKAQGLRSAPSKVRLLRYSPQQQEEGGASGSGLLVEAKDSVVDDDDEERRGTAEGTLLVRETVSHNDSALQQLHQR